MSAAERLDAIEREIQFAMMPLGARAGVKSMTAALRAVWEVVDDNTSTTAMQVRAAITAALDVTS